MLSMIWNKALEKAESVTGSDGREDVSSRSSSRLYYCSRDKECVFSWKAFYTSSAVGEYAMYLKNDSLTESIVIDSIRCFADAKCDFDVVFVTGTASGTTVPSVNWNSESTETADATCLNGGVSGLSITGDIVDIEVSAGARANEDLKDALRIAPGKAIAVKVDAVTHISINILGFFE